MMNHSHYATLSRRRWLQTAAGVLGTGLLPLGANAQSAGGYKALVCVFLYGGNDGLNSLVPTDARYAQYQSVRGSLAVAQGSLIGLDGVPFGLHPSLNKLQSIWNAGQMTAVCNVGPLIRPFVDKADFTEQLKLRSATVPPSLYSHDDQQMLWQSGDGNLFSRSGWGGRGLAAVSPGQSVIAIGSNAHFGRSGNGAPLVLPRPGSGFQVTGLQNPTYEDDKKRKVAFDALYAKRGYPSELADLFAQQQQAAMTVSAELSPVLKSTPADLPSGDAIRTGFAPVTKADAKGLTTDLAAQLFQVAKLIRQGQSQGKGTQIFFVSAGGYDTHSDQPNRQAGLLTDLGGALAAFHASMQNLSLGQQVTTFTESDFGRTFAPNKSNGTDHAWGNIHFVLGGAVKGKAVHGTYPSLELGGPDDVGVQSWEHQGRWIPSVGVDQYAATLLSWAGVPDGQLASVLPNLPNFAQPKIGFI